MLIEPPESIPNCDLPVIILPATKLYSTFARMPAPPPPSALLVKRLFCIVSALPDAAMPYSLLSWQLLPVTRIESASGLALPHTGELVLLALKLPIDIPR